MNKSDHEIDYFKTPSPSRRKMPQRSLFTDRCSRSQTSIKQNKFQSDLDMLPSTPIFSSPMRSSKRDRCRTDPIPRKFRCEMPISARKIEAKPLPPSERAFTPIIQSSFYGKKSKSLENPSANDAVSPSSSNTGRSITSEITKRPALKSIQLQSSDNSRGNQGNKEKLRIRGARSVNRFSRYFNNTLTLFQVIIHQGGKRNTNYFNVTLLVEAL